MNWPQTLDLAPVGLVGRRVAARVGAREIHVSHDSGLITRRGCPDPDGPRDA